MSYPTVQTLRAQLRRAQLHLIADAIEAHTGQRPGKVTVHWERTELGLPLPVTVASDGRVFGPEALGSAAQDELTELLEQDFDPAQIHGAVIYEIEAEKDRAERGIMPHHT